MRSLFRLFLTIVVFFALLSPTPSMAYEAVWWASAYFNKDLNPSGPWSYGWGTPAGDFTLYPINTPLMSGWEGTGVVFWYDNRQEFVDTYTNIFAQGPVFPFIGHNLTGHNLQVPTGESGGETITYPGLALALHPGVDPFHSILRWTAPSDGIYDVVYFIDASQEDSVFGDWNASADLHILYGLNNQLIDDLNVTVGSMPSYTSNPIPLRAGDFFEFALGQPWFDPTPLRDTTFVDMRVGLIGDFQQLPFVGYRKEIQAVPEPTTLLLLGSGLIGLAGYGRKKFFKK